MSVRTGNDVTTRLPALDTLRAVLVAWIIGGHALLGYSAIGGWAYDEVNEVSFTAQAELVLLALLGPSALFVLGTFFLLAGLCTPASFDRRGARTFVRRRLLRLGVPFAVSVLVLWPLPVLLAYRAAGRDVSYGWVLTGRDRFLDSGALWFAVVLLLFSLAYAALRSLRRPAGDRAPVPVTGWRLAGLAATLTLATFTVRLWTSARETDVLDLHLWLWPQLGVMFAFGIAHARGGLAAHVPDRLYRGCGRTTAAVVAALPVLALILAGADLTTGAAPFLGGPHWQALALAGVEATLVVAGSVWLLGLAQRRLAASGPLRTAAGRGSFAAFVLQGPVLLLLAVALRPFALPAEIKAPLVGALGIVLCFGLGLLAVQRTPLRRIL
ncbi:acyltransferase-like protein [Prauserella shujinwangii]|uniref:Acyltransferase-like protein n=1 Tax=Prauserella shujinwangii TaxID=1453103 RepID=A0A2T0LSJ5_9PSEU|nr:acyltransferase [Prauserella shujinwangii]PRX46585.1 acyltransferase-like protein [Prauserella shujinwangii]